jgi:hypothetical protein
LTGLEGGCSAIRDGSVLTVIIEEIPKASAGDAEFIPCIIGPATDQADIVLVDQAYIFGYNPYAYKLSSLRMNIIPLSE